jgi:hypothetical protein
MAAPIHTVKHIKNSYRKYQISVVIFALITIAATFLSAVSGVRVAMLQKQATAATAATAEEALAAQNSRVRQIDTLSRQLTVEKERTQKLLKKVAALENQISVLKKPAVPETPYKAIEPDTVTEPMVQPTPEETAPAEPPKTAPSPTGEPVETPPVQQVVPVPVPTAPSTPQAPDEPGQATPQAPDEPGQGTPQAPTTEPDQTTPQAPAAEPDQGTLQAPAEPGQSEQTPDDEPPETPTPSVQQPLERGAATE